MFSPTTASVSSALALADRLLKQVQTASRATLKHIAADLEVELGKIRKEREFLLRENADLKKQVSAQSKPSSN